MSPDMQKAARLDDLSSERGTRVCLKRGDKETPVLLIRDGNSVRAFTADCPHAGAPLEEGAICNGRIVCPWHKGTFALKDGSLVEPPALKVLTRYPVAVENGDVFVSLKAEETPAPQVIQSDKTMLIAGAGAAGAAACAALREMGFSGRIVLAGHDAPAPYDRTALSKFVIAGDMPVNEVPPLLDDDFFEKHKIDRVESNVMQLDVTNKHVEFINDTKLDYDAALICTGGIPKPLTMPGANLAHIHLLRHLDDANAILDTLKSLPEGARAVIVGASFIGLEVASCLRKRKLDVSVIAPGKVPFEKQFGARLGGMFKTLHEQNGVTFRMNAQVTAFRGGNAVREVVLDSGERLLADIVIAGTGVEPATAFLEGITTDKDGGLTVDSAMRAAPDLYAAGDVARFPLPHADETPRIEHWRVAQQQARVAAYNMAGIERAYEGVPYFWTFHYDKTFEYLGHASEMDQVEIDGDLDKQAFIAYLLKDGEVRGVVACERQTATCRLAEAMRDTLTLDQARGIANE